MWNMAAFTRRPNCLWPSLNTSRVSACCQCTCNCSMKADAWGSFACTLLPLSSRRRLLRPAGAAQLAPLIKHFGCLFRVTAFIKIKNTTQNWLVSNKVEEVNWCFGLLSCSQGVYELTSSVTLCWFLFLLVLLCKWAQYWFSFKRNQIRWKTEWPTGTCHYNQKQL